MFTDKALPSDLLRDGHYVLLDSLVLKWRKTFMSLLVLQFSQASAVRSYTKFVMGVSLSFKQSYEIFCACSVIENNADKCVPIDCSECSHLPLHAGG